MSIPYSYSITICSSKYQKSVYVSIPYSYSITRRNLGVSSAVATMMCQYLIVILSLNKYEKFAHRADVSIPYSYSITEMKNCERNNWGRGVSIPYSYSITFQQRNQNDVPLKVSIPYSYSITKKWISKNS